MTELHLDWLRARFIYDPETGWLRYARPQCGVGQTRRAGTQKQSGYREVKVLGTFYLEHRLIWFIVTGKWPEPECDHKSRVRNDNRWENLREATHSQNRCNSVGVGSATGFRGVYKNHKGFVAQIRISGKLVTLGTRKTPEEASQLYVEAATDLHGAFMVGA